MVGALTQSANASANTMPSDPRLHKAAQEFEAMLLADLMKIGTDQDHPDGDSDQSCHGYDDLRNQAVASSLARNGGIGIARILEQRLGDAAAIKEFSSSADTSIASTFKGDAPK